MKHETIKKLPEKWILEPNLKDYEAARHQMNWDMARRELSGLPDGKGLNIAYECLERHASGPLRDKIAIRWLSRHGETRDYTFNELNERANRFANALRSLGVNEGERVFSLLGRVPELYFAALGTLKAKAVFSPLFSAFGSEPVRTRLEMGDASVLVTTESLYKRKVAPIRGELPGLNHVLLIDTPEFETLMEQTGADFEIPPTDSEDMALIHFTSGTTGKPKGAVHVHEAVVAHHVTGKLALDLHPQDVFWCTADPGWVTGTSYGIISPLTNGVTMIVDEADFDADRWCRILQEQKVSVWYTAPTAIRMLMKAGSDLVKEYDTSHLRLIASVGEPLNPEAVVWGRRTFGRPIHDNWWQTETGGIMISNYVSMDIRPGSMGRPLPGVEALIATRERDGTVKRIREPGVEGELALKKGWPSMFRAYLHEEKRYRACFADDLYFTGDLARVDEDGYFWFVGRADDVIKSAGHLIGPFEVESVLMEHPAVAEAGVIGKPDPMVHETVKAFVSLKRGYASGEALRLELLGFARKRLGAAVAPKEIEIVGELPKTRSGKTMRRLLKARELGLPEGDTSMLEGAA